VGRIISYFLLTALILDLLLTKSPSSIAQGKLINEVAHEISRFCFPPRSSCNWVDEPTSFLLEKLINDVTELGLQQQVLDALFFLPGYLRGLEGFK
jgi:hypothetical protein